MEVRWTTESVLGANFLDSDGGNIIGVENTCDSSDGTTETVRIDGGAFRTDFYVLTDTNSSSSS